MISLSSSFLGMSVKTTVLCSTFALWPAELLLHTTTPLCVICFVKIWRLINASATTVTDKRHRSVQFDRFLPHLIRHQSLLCNTEAVPMRQLSIWFHAGSRVGGGWILSSADIGRGAGRNLYRTPVHHRSWHTETNTPTHAHTSRHRESSVNLLEYPEESSQIRKHTNK